MTILLCISITSLAVFVAIDIAQSINGRSAVSPTNHTAENASVKAPKAR